jgi:hypothetical protein
MSCDKFQLLALPNMMLQQHLLALANFHASKGKLLADRDDDSPTYKLLPQA